MGRIAAAFRQQFSVLDSSIATPAPAHSFMTKQWAWATASISCRCSRPASSGSRPSPSPYIAMVIASFAEECCPDVQYCRDTLLGGVEPDKGYQ
jgi:hypothetical protein